MDIVTLIWAVTSGSVGAFVAGWLAKFLLPGEQRIRTMGLILIGSIAGIIAGVISGLFDLDDGEGVEWWAFGISVALSMLAIFFLSRWKNAKLDALLKVPAHGAAASGAGRADLPTGGTTTARPPAATAEKPKATAPKKKR